MSYNPQRADNTILPVDAVIQVYDLTTKTMEERVLTDANGVTWDLATAGQIKASVAAGNTIYSADDTIAASRTVTIAAATIMDFDITGTGSFTISDGGTAFATFADGGGTTLTGDIAVNGGDVTTTATTATLFNTGATTLSIGGASTTTSIGAATGTTTIGNNLTVTGDLQVLGDGGFFDVGTVTIEDLNIQLASNAAGAAILADAGVDGGGLTLMSTDSNKTFSWVDATNAWTSSEHIALLAGKDILLNGATSGTVTLSVPAVAGTTAFVLPPDNGTANFVLRTDGSGVGTWVDPSTLVDNIYSADGTLAGARTVTLGGNTLTFAGTANLVVRANGDLQVDSGIIHTPHMTVATNSAFGYGGFEATAVTTTDIGYIASKSGSASSAGAEISMYEGPTNGSAFIGFKAPDALTNSITITLPSSTPVVGDILSVSALSGVNPTTVWLNASVRTVNTQTTSYTITLADEIIRLDSTTATMTLPTAVGNEGIQFTIKQVAATPTTANVDAAGTETIDGQLTYLFSQQYESITVVSNNVSWDII